MERAAARAARIERDFGPEVMALEAGDGPVPGAGSQLGWLLWSGALSGESRAALARRLCEPDILTAHGLRTLSQASPVFDPQAYHRGTIWPFDSWLGWGGLRAAGFHAEAERVRTGVLAALDALGQAPELYAVTRGWRARAGARRQPRARRGASARAGRSSTTGTRANPEPS